MHHDRRDAAQTHQPSIQGLIADALRETTDLARKEIALFRTEMSHNARVFLLGIVGLVVAAIFAVATLILLTEALVDWVSARVESEALGALIVAGLTLVITIACALWARSKLSAATLEPTHTIRSVERDSEVLTERLHS